MLNTDEKASMEEYNMQGTKEKLLISAKWYKNTWLQYTYIVPVAKSWDDKETIGQHDCYKTDK